MVGRDDEYTPVEWATRTAGYIPGAELVVIDGAGHLRQPRTTGGVRPALAEFLKPRATELMHGDGAADRPGYWSELGFGAAVVRRFALDGARVVAAARRADRLAGLAADLGADVLPVVLDVTDPGGNVYGATKAFVHQFSLNLRSDRTVRAFA